MASGAKKDISGDAGDNSSIGKEMVVRALLLYQARSEALLLWS